MAKTDSFRKQHVEIVEIVGKITKLLDPAKLATDANEARTLLSAMAGKLTFHLNMEDKFLYPKMIDSGDVEAKKQAEGFMKEIGGIAGAFGDYSKKWASAATIQGDAAGFCSHTKDIFKALADRVGREESVLYPLADKTI